MSVFESHGLSCLFQITPGNAEQDTEWNNSTCGVGLVGKCMHLLLH